MGVALVPIAMMTGLLARVHEPPARPPVDFDRDIRPILADACFKCHGPHEEKREARLRLDIRDGLFAPTRDADDPDRFAEWPSRIVMPGKPGESEMARRVLSQDDDERMPPPDAARQLTDAERTRIKEWIESGAAWSGHWAFEPIKRPPVPEPAKAGGVSWPGNEIDRFVLAEIGRYKLPGVSGPSPQADKRTLIRRLTLDLTGLPPTRDEVAAFVKDESPEAYARAVDRLLASTAFGEHFATAWLDAARYADSNGFQIDPDRTAWPWRDWVVRAFNSNMPYDRFVVEQLAGDLLPEATSEQVLATAFNRNHPINGEGGSDKEESRITYVHDRVDTTSTTFLGLTMTCAQCHDHKYDPFSQRDYYQMFAFFNSVDEDGNGDKGDVEPLADYKDPSGKDLKIMVMRDRKERRETHLLERGVWDHPGERVETATPGALPAMDGAPQSPGRLELARWITARSNPLTARVAVNRLWQQVFGEGLVRTPENFGIQGERPTHPELLDWLASRFVESGWDVKAMLKMFVMSGTYRQSSVCSAELLATDPANRLLARSPRYRLTAGVIRDQALMISGLLVSKVGGPPVKPYHPAGVWEDVSFGRLKYQQGTGEDLYRRSLYTFWRRTAAPANMFDTPLRQKCSVRVIRTNTPLQAMILMNDPTYTEAAAALGERAIASASDDNTRLAWAFEEATSRPPQDAVVAILKRRLDSLRTYYGKHFDEATSAANAGARPDPPADKVTEVAAYAGVMGVILNLDEVLTRE
ncbi:MAG: PSD1 and planctomycete cytochrome C domain-containing protein [Planctomycetota bacterium]